MLVSRVRVTSQIHCGDVTMLNRKRPSLATVAKWAIDHCFSRIVCSGHKIACKKWNNTFVTVINDFLGHSWCDLPMIFIRDEPMIFTRDFVTRENHWQIASLVTQKSLFTVITHALFFIHNLVRGSTKPVGLLQPSLLHTFLSCYCKLYVQIYPSQTPHPYDIDTCIIKKYLCLEMFYIRNCTVPDILFVCRMCCLCGYKVIFNLNLNWIAYLFISRLQL